MAPKSWVRVPLLTIFKIFMVIENTLRYAPRFSKVVAFVSKIDATGNMPRSMAKSFSRARSYRASIRYDINDFSDYSPDLANYSKFFARPRAPHYTPFRPAYYPVAKRHLLAEQYAHTSPFGWGHSEEFIFTKLKKTKKGFILFARAQGCSNFAFFYRPASVFLKKLQNFRLYAKKPRRANLKFKRKFRKFRGLYRYPFRKFLVRRKQFTQAFRLRTWRSLLARTSFSVFGSRRKRVRFNRSIFRRLRRRMGKRIRLSRRLPITCSFLRAPASIYFWLRARAQRIVYRSSPSSFRLLTALVRRPTSSFKVISTRTRLKFFFRKYQTFFSAARRCAQRNFVSSRKSVFHFLAHRTRSSMPALLARRLQKSFISRLAAFYKLRSAVQPTNVRSARFEYLFSYFGFGRPSATKFISRFVPRSSLIRLRRYFRRLPNRPIIRRFTHVNKKVFLTILGRLMRTSSIRSRRFSARLLPTLFFFNQHFRSVSLPALPFFNFQLYTMRYVHFTPGRFSAPISPRHTTLSLR